MSDRIKDILIVDADVESRHLVEGLFGKAMRIESRGRAEEGGLFFNGT